METQMESRPVDAVGEAEGAQTERVAWRVYATMCKIDS